MTLRQSHFVPPVPLVLAQQHGLLGGIDLRVERASGSAHQLAELLAGDVDMVVTAIDNLFEWLPAGADVRLVAQVERTTPLRLFALPKIDHLAALSGSSFGVDAVDNGFSLVARHILADAGVDVRYVEVGGVAERFEALTVSRVDATLLGPPFTGMASAAGMRELAAIEELLPAFPGQGLIVRADLLGSPELTHYLAGLDAAVALTASLTRGQGIAALERAGLVAGASALWDARPTALRPSTAGLDLLVSIRDGMGMLPAGIDLHALTIDTPGL